VADDDAPGLARHLLGEGGSERPGDVGVELLADEPADVVGLHEGGQVAACGGVVRRGRGLGGHGRRA
jgi:hypothetical protein